MATPLYIPTNSMQGVRFFYILVNTCYFIIFFLMVATVMGVNCYLTAVLTWISLMFSDGEYLFTCLLAMYISFLEKCLFKSFAHFWFRLFVFWLLSLESTLHMDINTFSAVWYKKCFFLFLGLCGTDLSKCSVQITNVIWVKEIWE